MTINHTDRPYIAALDIGGRRIGVALARFDVRLASPYRTLINDETIWEQLQTVIEEERVGRIVAGLPRGLNGQETDQTRTVRAFVADLQKHFDMPVAWQDEAGTSLQAEAELQQRSKRYNKADIDAQAAAIILQDYLDNQPSSRQEETV